MIFILLFCSIIHQAFPSTYTLQSNSALPLPLFVLPLDNQTINLQPALHLISPTVIRSNCFSVVGTGDDTVISPCKHGISQTLFDLQNSTLHAHNLAFQLGELSMAKATSNSVVHLDLCILTSPDSSPLFDVSDSICILTSFTTLDIPQSHSLISPNPLTSLHLVSTIISNISHNIDPSGVPFHKPFSTSPSSTTVVSSTFKDSENVLYGPIFPNINDQIDFFSRNNTFSYIQSHPHHTHFDDPPIFADNQVHTKRQVILTNTAKFEGDEFYHCSAHLDNGGAISCVGKHTLVLDTCGFMFCSTSGHSKFGGAVYMTVHSPTSPSDGTLNIIRSVFTSCKSDTGGAVYTADLKETHFLNGVCETCEGTSGGALCMELSTVAQSFVNSRFKQCKVSVSGSAISLTCRIPVTITNVSLHEGEVNTPTGSYISGAAIILTQNTIVDQIKFLYLYFADNMAKSSDSRKIPSDILFVHNWREEVRAQFEECYTISAEPCVMHWDGGSHKQINKLLQTPTNSFHVLLSTDPPEDCEDSPYCAIGERPCRTVNYAISRCSKTDLIDRIIYISAGVSSERLIEVVGQTVSLEGAHHNPSSSLETVFSPTLQTAEAKSMFVVTSGTIRFSKIEFWPPVSTSAVTYYACLLTSDTAVGKSSTVTFSDCVISAPATAQLNTLHFPPLFEFTDSDVEFDSVSFFASTENPNQLPVFTENPIFVGVQFRASQFMMSHCRVGQTQVVDGSWLLLTREVKAELSAEFALVAFISNTSFRGISRINSGACVLESRREMGSEETQAEITLSKCSISECELRGYVQHGNLLYFYRSTVLINGTRIEGQGGVGEVDTPQDNSTRIQSHPSNTEITEEMCSKAGVAVWFTHSKARLESSSFVRCPTGAVQLTGRASSLFVSNVSFAANGCPVQHNLVCTGRGNRVEIDSLHSVDGVSLSDPIRANASLWMWTEECWMGGRFVEMESMPSLLFIPSMENVSKATSSEGAMDLIVKGKDLFPCPLKLQLFEIVKEKKTKAEKEQNTTNIDVLSTLDSTAFHIAISANTTNSTNEWRVRLLFVDGVAGMSTFVGTESLVVQVAKPKRTLLIVGIVGSVCGVLVVVGVVAGVVVCAVCRRRRDERAQKKWLALLHRPSQGEKQKLLPNSTPLSFQSAQVAAAFTVSVTQGASVTALDGDSTFLQTQMSFKKKKKGGKKKKKKIGSVNGSINSVPNE